MKKEIKNLTCMTAAILTCGLMLTACSVEDNPTPEPTQPKKVSQLINYKVVGDELQKTGCHYFSYNAQGKIAEWKYFVCDNDDTEELKETMTFSYAADRIRTVNTIYPVTAEAEIIVLEDDCELDGNGRIVKKTNYSYLANGSIQDCVNPSIYVYTYDEQGYMTEYEDEDWKSVYEWKDGKLYREFGYDAGALLNDITYEYSEEPACFILQFKDLMPFNFLAMEGYYGQQSQFLPAKYKRKVYSNNMVVFTTESSIAYEKTDGLVTAWHNLEEFMVLNQPASLQTKSVVMYE